MRLIKITLLSIALIVISCTQTHAATGDYYLPTSLNFTAKSGTLSPADGSTYYITSDSAWATSLSTSSALFVSTMVGTVTAMNLHFHTNGTLGSSETSTIYLYNETSATSTLCASNVRFNSATTNVNCSPSAATNPNDALAIKIVFATWATNPTNIILVGGTITQSQLQALEGVSDFVQTSRTINGYDLSENRTLTASDVSAVPTTRTITINDATQDLSQNRSWTVSGGGDATGDYVPTSRTINGHSLTDNVTLDYNDTQSVPNTRTINSVSLSQDATIDLTPFMTFAELLTTNTGWLALCVLVMLAVTWIIVKNQ